jgi:HEAT repeat protein
MTRWMSDQLRPEVLISRLTAPNESWRLDAERRLIALGSPAVDALIGALQHAYPAVRVHAAHALAQIGDPRALSPLVAALGDSENSGAGAIAAERALVAWGEAAKGHLLEAAIHGPPHLRPRAIRALGRIGGADLESMLRSLLADPAAPVRTQAAAALAAALQQDAIEQIAPLLADPDKWVRYGVAEALVQIGCIRGQPALESARDDPEEEGGYVKLWAEELLDQIGELKRTGRAIP